MSEQTGPRDLLGGELLDKQILKNLSRQPGKSKYSFVDRDSLNFFRTRRELNKCPIRPEIAALINMKRRKELSKEGRYRLKELWDSRPVLNKTLNSNTLKKISKELAAENVHALFQTSKTTRNALKGVTKPAITPRNALKRHLITNENAELLIAPLMKVHFNNIKLGNDQIASIARPITKKKSKEGRETMLKMIRKLMEHPDAYNAMPISVLSRMSEGDGYNLGHFLKNYIVLNLFPNAESRRLRKITKKGKSTKSIKSH